jgi:hypothetical protein
MNHHELAMNDEKRDEQAARSTAQHASKEHARKEHASKEPQ